jgi:hypothetical protein
MAPSMLDDFIPKAQQDLLDDLQDQPYDEPTEGDIVEWLALPTDRECNNKRALKVALREIHEKWILGKSTMKQCAAPRYLRPLLTMVHIAARDLQKLKNAQEKRKQKVENDRRRESGERLDGRPQRDAARIAKANMKRCR